jgi:hypothetical protein
VTKVTVTLPDGVDDPPEVTEEPLDETLDPPEVTEEPPEETLDPPEETDEPPEDVVPDVVEAKVWVPAQNTRSPPE